MFGCALQLLFLNHEPRNARLCCFYVREMRAAGCDEALYDYKNRIAKAVEIHRKITALDENCSYVCEMTLPETRAEMFELINPYSVLTSSLITGTSRGDRRNKNLGHRWARGRRFARGSRQIQDSDRHAQT